MSLEQHVHDQLELIHTLVRLELVVFHITTLLRPGEGVSKGFTVRAPELDLLVHSA